MTDLNVRRLRVTLCGSTRFKRAWAEWNARLTLEGMVVYSVAMWSHSVRVEPTEEQKRILDAVHMAKIDNSDEVFVLDVGGYIGESTKREIAHAEATGKRVRYLSKEYPLWTEDDCTWTRQDEVSGEAPVGGGDVGHEDGFSGEGGASPHRCVTEGKMPPMPGPVYLVDGVYFQPMSDPFKCSICGATEPCKHVIVGVERPRELCGPCIHLRNGDGTPKCQEWPYSKKCEEIREVIELPQAAREESMRSRAKPRMPIQVGHRVEFETLPSFGGGGDKMLRCCACGHEFECDPDKGINCRVTRDNNAYPRCPACGVGL